MTTKEQVSSSDLFEASSLGVLCKYHHQQNLYCTYWWMNAYFDRRQVSSIYCSMATHGHCFWIFQKQLLVKPGVWWRKNPRPYNFLCGCQSIGLIVSLDSYASQTGCLQHFVIRFGRFTRWLRCGINIWLLSLSLDASVVLMKACLSGIASSPVLDRFFVHGSHINLAMSITLFSVLRVEYSHKLNLLKGSTVQRNF